jgi:hypothetical protein
MAERLYQFLSHLKVGSTGIAAISQKNPDDVVITLAVRTPLTKARKGGLKDTTLEHMLLRLYLVNQSYSMIQFRVFLENQKSSQKQYRISSLEMPSILMQYIKFEQPP